MSGFLQGCDQFVAKINAEVQWTSELVIAAIEKNGGTITTRYYDPSCLAALYDPLAFFKKGQPIPKCKLPPQVNYAMNLRMESSLSNFTEKEFIFNFKLSEISIKP